jgi:hypothetical protein
MAGRGQSFLVDQHPEKQKIIDGILSGQSVRAIARSVNPPIEFNAIQRYKTRIVRPILARAEENERLMGELQATSPATRPPKPSPVALQKTATAIQDAPRLSIFRQRLEKIWERTDRTLDKAESAVRVGKDDEGNIVFGAQDITPIAPLLAQAHRNAEILGKATGELEAQVAGSFSIQVICPSTTGATSADLPRVTYSATPQIEGGDEVEIGVRQG